MTDQHLSDSIFGGREGAVTAGEGPGDGAGRTPTRRPPHRRKRGPVLILLVLVALAAAVLVAGLVLKPVVAGFLGPDDYAASDATGKKVPVTIAADANGRAIGETLEKAGVIKSAGAFVDAAREDSRAQSIQPGSYLMAEHQPAKAAIDYLANPRNRVVKRVTVPEGMRASEVYAVLSKASGLPVADYQKAAKDTAALALPSSAKGNVEGYLFPSSYEFGPKSTAAQQLAAMVAKTKDVLAGLGVSDDKAERVIIVASIVESESRLDADRGKVARVLENRLAVPMRLQLDSTVAYATGKRVITTTDAERAQVNGYNTYTRDGLPVGPIGNPGEESIKAAVNPAQGPWLFFVTVDPATGETVFTENKADHDKAVLQFQAWCQAHKGQC
ncbi:endolytic transglycosylase MltG [Arsenicicoccus sp. MKL-02]|uniref:Endolytic murein transglycosylase n=1 Tax=Arsenicicoccus cauae TaxID=2663847 RepID=A0A6I3INF3_9MICO|nr:endolytic transglycosylase MltG [Arsenicicoccus cauae]MTB73175.1 endolytic transglycosylase MltG [Arsenicicoccus cauae]